MKSKLFALGCLILMLFCANSQAAGVIQSKGYFQDKFRQLDEVLPSQVNHVNVEKLGRTSSARLIVDDQFKTIRLDQTK